MSGLTDEDFAECFRQYTDDDPDHVSREHLPQMVKQLQRPFSLRYINKAMEERQMGDLQTLTLEDFKNLLTPTPEEQKEIDTLLGHFEVFDENNDGTLSYKELTDSLVNFGDKLTPEEASVLCSLVEVDDNSRFSYIPLATFLVCETLNA